MRVSAHRFKTPFQTRSIGQAICQSSVGCNLKHQLKNKSLWQSSFANSTAIAVYGFYSFGHFFTSCLYLYS